jgi:hypothetical protein
MSLYSWIFGEETITVESPVVVHTIEEMVKSHGEKKIELEESESAVAKLKADLETLRIAISNRLESEKNRISCNTSESISSTLSCDVEKYNIKIHNKANDTLSSDSSGTRATKRTAQPMFY